MKSEIQSLSDIFYSSIPLLSKYVGNEPVQCLKERLVQKTVDATPTVMVFGIYNAGKSTFLNALIGETRAKMSDRPETSIVTSYEWNGFHLLDTPGIDAPSDHERVSREQLEKSDVILFVLGTDGGFEEEYVYREIVNIAQSSRLMMLIINNKNGYNEGESSYREVYDKILANLNKAGKENNLPNLVEDVQPHLVNAKSALKGKQEGKSNLVKKSRIAEVSQSIEKLLMKSGTHQVVLVLRADVIKLIDSSLQKIDALQFNVPNRRLSDSQEAIRLEKCRIAKSVINGIGVVTNEFSRKFLTAVRARDELLMNSAFESACKAVENILEREITDANQRLISLGVSLNGVVNISSFSNASTDLPALGDIGTSNSDLDATSAALKSVKGVVSHVGQKGIEEATKNATKLALEVTKEWLPSLMKGTGAKTIEKIASGMGNSMGKVVPFIGPAIDVAIGIFGYYNEDKKQKEQEEALRREAQSLISHVNQTTDRLNGELSDMAQKIIEPMFEPLEKLLTEKLNVLQKDQRSSLEDRQALELIKLNLEKLVVN